MATPKELANKARTTLAQALGALQSPGVPDDLVTIAEPIARTMGMLHRIEKEGSTTEEACAEALDTTRSVLDALQRHSGSHAAVDTAMEAVAGSLSKLFALARSVRPSSPPAEPVQHAPAAAPQPAFQANPAFQAPAAAPQPAYQAPQPAYQAPQPAYQAPQPAPAAPQPAYQPAYQAPQPAPQPAFQAAQPAYQPAPAAPAAPAAAAHNPFAGGHYDRPLSELNATMPIESAQHAADLLPAGAGGDAVLVELGAHSDSNFYKGLSGNDVIDHGGIFVATYKIPKLGSTVSLRIHLPGDLEFLADAVVQWTRETRSGESEPGFGAKITRVSDEGRQLCYRYVRNREPMFYDDM